MCSDLHTEFFQGNEDQVEGIVEPSADYICLLGGIGYIFFTKERYWCRLQGQL